MTLSMLTLRANALLKPFRVAASILSHRVVMIFVRHDLFALDITHDFKSRDTRTIAFRGRIRNQSSGSPSFTPGTILSRCCTYRMQLYTILLRFFALGLSLFKKAK